jgi:diguanylate cyclase (GGDEF)-like protein
VDTLQERIYHLVLDVIVFASVIAVVIGLLQRQPRQAMISIALVLLFLIIIQFVTIRYPKYSKACRVVLVFGLNFVLFPYSFFVSGGIHSGMVLFYLTGLYLCAILLKGKTGQIVFLASLAWMELSIIVGQKFPGLVPEVTQDQHVRIVRMSLVLAGVAIYALTVLIFMSYDNERRQNEDLMKTLQQLSVKDVLSGLYNRRELFRRLEDMYGGQERKRDTLTRDGRYIAMFDVDDFKKLNDTYGHSFGDQVLVSVAKVLSDMVRLDRGELTARYGGEEFVSILIAQDKEEAFERVNLAVQEISQLRWNEAPEVRVSISGGLISCEEHPNLTQAMHDVDELLYKAKAAGKNQIIVK